MKLEQVLKIAVRGGASDIILKVGSLPRFRHNGQMLSLADGMEITEEMMNHWLDIILPRRLYHRLEEKGDVDFGYDSPNKTRFRVNVFRQCGKYAVVLRVINDQLQSIEQLQLPKIIEKVTNMKRGLVLVTGASGSGKSTTLTAIINHINQSRSSHIITIEDPIEYYYSDKLSTINQREIGEDTPSFASALRASLRQDPDIILVGELRDKETTETALMAADTGHLVFSTLHTKDAVDSLSRLMSYFDAHQHRSLKNQLANSLQMVISQRLIPKTAEKGRIVAAEILVVNAFVRDVILKESHFEALGEAINKGQKNYGMQSFDQALLKMLKNGIISEEQAIAEASSRENMRLLISGVGAG